MQGYESDTYSHASTGTMDQDPYFLLRQGDVRFTPHQNQRYQFLSAIHRTRPRIDFRVQGLAAEARRQSNAMNRRVYNDYIDRVFRGPGNRNPNLNPTLQTLETINRMPGRDNRIRSMQDFIRYARLDPYTGAPLDPNQYDSQAVEWLRNRIRLHQSGVRRLRRRDVTAYLENNITRIPNRSWTRTRDLPDLPDNDYNRNVRRRYN